MTKKWAVITRHSNVSDSSAVRCCPWCVVCLSIGRAVESLLHPVESRRVYALLASVMFGRHVRKHDVVHKPDGLHSVSKRHYKRTEPATAIRDMREIDEIGSVVWEICTLTDRRTDRQTRRKTHTDRHDHRRFTVCRSHTGVAG